MFYKVLLVLILIPNCFGQQLVWNELPQSTSIPIKVTDGNFEWKQVEKGGKPKAKLIKTGRQFQNSESIQAKSLPKAQLSIIDIQSTRTFIKDNWNYTDNAVVDITVLSRKVIPSMVSMQSLAQLSDGRMIFGGHDVFFIYDGHFLMEYSSNEEYAFGQITSIMVDSKGGAWICTDYGLYYYQDDKFYRIDNLNFGKAWEIWEDIDGSFWVGTAMKGMFHLKSDITLHYYDKKNFIEVFDFERAEDGTLYVVETNAIYKIQGGTWHKIQREYDNVFRCIEQQGNKYIVGTFRGGVYELDQDELIRLDLPINTYSVYNVAVTKNGIWIPSYGNGVVFVDHNYNYQHINIEEGLIGNWSLKLDVDRFGNVWVCDLSNGISKISESNLKLSQDESLSGVIQSLQLNDQTIQLKEGEILRKTKDGAEQIYFKNSPFFSQELATNGRSLFAGNYEHGIYVFNLEKKNYQLLLPQEEAYGFYVLKNCIDNHNRYWFTNYNRELRVLDNGRLINLSAKEPFSRLKALDVKSTLDGIVVEFDQGIALIKNDKYLFLNKQNGLANNSTLGIWSSGEEEEIIIFNQTGMQFLKKGVIVKTISSDIPYKLGQLSPIPLGENKWFLNGTKGSKVIEVLKDRIIDDKRQNFNGEYAIELINISSDFPLFFRNQNSIIEYSPNWHNRPELFGEISLQSIHSGGSKPTKKLKFTQEDQIRFDYTVNSFSKIKKCEYRLKRNGVLRADWSSFTDQSVTMDKLPYGKYVLETRVINEFGNGPILFTEFVVAPYWYQRWYSILLGILLIVLLSSLYFRRRLKREHRLRKRLEQIVAKKTRELQLEKEHVEHELAAKEILLKEVNHRVKNNMQMVSSVLELQRSKEESEHKSTLSKAINRIKALAFAHQYLYKNEQYESINIAEYLLLIADNVTSQTGIKLSIHIPNELMMHIEKAQALGVVTNELLSNSIKHAWNESHLEKEINIDVQYNDQQVVFSYNDNGVGLSQSGESNTLGMRLIDSFVLRRLNGTYQIEKSDGYKITLNFSSV